MNQGARDENEKMFRNSIVSQLKRIATNMKESAPCASTNTGSPKLPTFEEVNDARLENTDPMLENVSKKQLRAVYDLICRQLRASA